MWQAFIHWFTEVINLIYGFTAQFGIPSYGLAIIIMTIAIKLVLFPLTQQQMRSMRAMQEIQPKTKYIQEKYKDDPQLMQKKIMEMYKEHGVNPMGGCLPLVIQMPIFLAFYQSLYKFQYVEGANTGFLWIANIGQKVSDSVKMAPHDVSIVLLFILPVLAGLTTYLQQRVSMVENNDPTQKAMLYFMPVMMGYIAYTVPAGLGLYWVVFNTLGILQQLYVNRIHQRPKLVTGTGVEVEMPSNIAEPDYQPGSGTEAVGQRDKGGSEKDAGAINRKKRKKR